MSNDQDETTCEDEGCGCGGCDDCGVCLESDEPHAPACSEAARGDVEGEPTYHDQQIELGYTCLDPCCAEDWETSEQALVDSLRDYSQSELIEEVLATRAERDALRQRLEAVRARLVEQGYGPGDDEPLDALLNTNTGR